MYKLEPAFAVSAGLSRKLVLAGMDIKNQWFFTNGGFIENGLVNHQPNTCLMEDFVVLDEEGIVAYFCGTWNKPINVIAGFRMILFEDDKSIITVKAFFEYLEYLFISRGCNAFNWLVADKNVHAKKIYEKFIKNYMGHVSGKKHYGQQSYTGEISDITLYEITKEEYFLWKRKQ